MSIKYFTGSNLDASNTKISSIKTYPTSRAGDGSGSGATPLTSQGLVETEPAANEDGVDPKPDRNLSKYELIRRKVYTKTGDSIGKAGFDTETNKGCLINLGGTSGKSRVSRLKGKYELGKMWKYRKTLKKLFTDIGFTAQSGSIGERNMYNGKNNGRVGNYKAGRNANDYPLYPMDAAK